MLVKCLYCDLEMDALITGGYCENCGKRLPTSAMVRTRKALTTGSEVENLTTTPASRSPTAEAFFTTAVVQLIAGGLFLVVGPALLSQVPENFLSLVLAWTMIPTFALGLLGWWARSQPRLAVITAIAFYAVWMIAGLVLQPAMGQAWMVVHAVMAGMLSWIGWVGLRSSKGDRKWL